MVSRNFDPAKGNKGFGISISVRGLIKKNSCSIPTHLIRIVDFERMPV